MPLTSARVAFSVTLSLLALLPSPSLQDRAWTLDDGFSDRYETTATGSPGRSTWNGNTEFSGPSSHNIWGGGGRGSPGGHGLPGLGGGSSSGLNDKRPSGWNKVDTESSSGGETYSRSNKGENSRQNKGENYSRSNKGETYSRSNSGESYQRSNNGENYSRTNKGENYSRSNKGENYSSSNSGENYSRSNKGETNSRPNSGESYSRSNKAETYSRSNNGESYSRPNNDENYSRSNKGENNPRLNNDENYQRSNNNENYRPNNNENYPRLNNDENYNSQSNNGENYPRSNNGDNYPHSNAGSTQRPYSDYDRESPRGPDDRVSDRNEYPQSRQCRDNEFRCGNNECLPRSVKCDNKVDCRDGSDEESCIANRNEQDGCVLPEQPEGGHYELSDCNRHCTKRPGDMVPKNSILNYTCKSNYMLKGNTISVCVDNKWYKPPRCHKICPSLNSTSVDISCSYQGETVSCSERILPGTRATLACKSSYKLPLTNDPAYRNITCLDDGLWDRRLFRCLPECGTSVARGNTLIVSGFQAKVGAFPWHVGIYSKERTGEYQQICGGTLINNNLVVSAAHCFYDEVYNQMHDASKYSVAAGKHYRDWNAREKYAQKSSVESIRAPDRYQGARGNFAEDIALLKLKTPFELTSLVRPVCIDWDNTHEREQLQVGHAGKVAGWGKDIKGESTRSLQEIDMPFVPYDQCLSAVPVDFRGFLTSDKFCAGHLNGSSVCDGDSGGGLCFEKDGVWYLRGVVSVSPENRGSCDYNSYVGFTYTSHFRDWIREAYVNA
ncbi:PREDICTED: serine protease nudel-like isoform X2 [Wasmannia auropunctata]|uniref:serine protease nudel-like isoform X2 n=1 Tax=Wasmannia auropunctata TaxID=64793 RepID=UPI0005F01C05|nr:PREDICTED: serine protease nudel-like isoform X2 [Wasmannia auropunctata]